MRGNSDVKVHTMETEGLMYKRPQTTAPVAAIQVKFEYRESNPFECHVYFSNPLSGDTAHWQVSRSLLRDGFYQETYPLIGDFRTRTSVGSRGTLYVDASEYIYFIALRSGNEAADISIADYDAVEEFVDGIYESIPEGEEPEIQGWDDVLDKLLRSGDSS